MAAKLRNSTGARVIYECRYGVGCVLEKTNFVYALALDGLVIYNFALGGILE